MAHHVGASFASLAPTFFKSQSALAPLLLLSKPDPLPLGSGLVFGERYKSCIATRTTSEQALYRLLRLFSKVRARLRRRSSLPNRTRCRWAPVWFFCCIAKSALLRLIFFACGFKISRTPALLFYLFRRKSRFVGTSCARSNSLA